MPVERRSKAERYETLCVSTQSGPAINTHLLKKLIESTNFDAIKKIAHKKITLSHSEKFNDFL
jgi:hypothetical protein